MFCSQCGKYLPDDSAFCDQCGVATASAEPVRPVSVYPVAPPAPVAPAEPKQMSMKWFGFLIYFYLFASSTGCILSGVLTAIGTQRENAALLYSVVPGLQAFDICFGVMSVLMGAFGILTRFRLSGRYRNGPKFLAIFFIADCVWQVLFFVGDLLFQPMLAWEAILTKASDAITGLAPSVVLLIVSLVYFKKRKDMFTK